MECEGDWPASILLRIRPLQVCLLDDVERYATRSAADARGSERRIDGVHEPSSLHSIRLTGIVHANLHDQDQAIRDVYVRQHPDVRRAGPPPAS